MLTLTDNAASIVKGLSDRNLGTETGGLRIATTEADVTDFEVTLAAEPSPDDQIVQSSGASVFLEKVASEVLADKQLDATVNDEGAVRFVIAEQG
jgi:Fe-S cluster assembly iron-binding protein IscA